MRNTRGREARASNPSPSTRTKFGAVPRDYQEVSGGANQRTDEYRISLLRPAHGGGGMRTVKGNDGKGFKR